MASGDDAGDRNTQVLRHPSAESQTSFLDYAVDWLNAFATRVPASIDQTGQGFYDALVLHGIVLDHAENGRVVCSLLVNPRLCNAGGRLHGGAIVSLVDVVGSAAIISTGVHSGVSLEINVSYMSEAPAKGEIEIEANTLRVGRKLAFVSVDIRRKGTGQLVAQGRHTKFLGTAATSKL